MTARLSQTQVSNMDEVIIKIQKTHIHCYIIKKIVFIAIERESSVVAL